MKTYKTLLFDLDDTLLNFSESEKLSFKHTMDILKVEIPFETLYTFYKAENSKLWDAFDKGLIEKDVLKVQRFRILIDQFDLTLNAEEMSQIYLDTLPETVVLLDGAIELLKSLQGKAQIGIITNGIGYIQHKRIEKSGIQNLVDFVCVSEECGYAKPDIRFFEYTSKNVNNFDKSATLIIGDRYEADILGGHKFGIDTCWFNHKNISQEAPIHTFEISSLQELKEKLSE